ncbi:MAG: cyclic nucleotide-binding domain-containing protein [Deltaproteobacteria bacterium]|nr:MAG: cyclic nucleotide-binding domain-containing protein [Deltaproteobacteria bacterium]
MLIDQTDLARGMSWEFTNEVYDITTTESFAKGDFLFREGDHAKYFYVLLDGRVRLSMGETGQVVYIVDRPGEAFGWSSLVGREVYSASAECVLASKLLRIDKDELEKILERKPADGMTFFRRLAGILGERLLSIYDTLGLG